MDRSNNYHVNIHDYAVSTIINTSEEMSGDLRFRKGKCTESNSGNKYSNTRDIDRFQKLIEFTTSIPSSTKLTRVVDKCELPDRVSKGHDESGKEILPCLQRTSCWGQRGHVSKALANHQTPGMTPPRSVAQCDDDVINTLSIAGSGNDFYADNNCDLDDEAESIADTDPHFGCADIKVSNPITPSISTLLTSPCISEVSMTVKHPSTETNNDISEADTRIERLLAKLSTARGTISEQKSVISNLEKRLFSIAESVSAVPCDMENDTEVLQAEFERAKKIIQAQCDQLEIYRLLIDKLKANKTKLKIELKSIKKERNASEESVDLLRRLVYQLQTRDNLVKSQIGAVNCDSDVLCLHDTFFKHIKTDLFEKQQLVMESVVCDHLSDALLQLERYKGKPRVVIVHTGKNDIGSLQVEEMCSIVSDIHACVTNNGSKLIMCNITPSYEKHDLARKVYLFNWNISSRLGAYDNVTICKGNGPSDQELLMQEYGSYYHVKKHFPRKFVRRNKPYQLRGKENYNEKSQTVSDAFDKQSITGLLRFN